MRILPFIITENDLNLRLLRTLVIINNLAYSARKRPILTIEKIAIYDYLLMYPAVLSDILKISNSKKKLELEQYEYYNMEANLNNRESIYNFELLNKIIQVLISYHYIEIINDSEILYIPSNNGLSFVDALNSDYSKRINYLTEFLLDMRSLNFSKINDLINKSFERMNEYEW